MYMYSFSSPMDEKVSSTISTYNFFGPLTLSRSDRAAAGHNTC